MKGLDINQVLHMTHTDAVERHKYGIITLKQLQANFIGGTDGGSDSIIDQTIDEIGYDQFIFYMFVAKEAELYAGQEYPLGFFD